MKQIHRKPLLIACLLAGASLAALATCATFILVNGMVEGPDPIPLGWPAVLEATQGETPDFGQDRAAVPTAIAFDPRTGNPAVVWEHWVGEDRDIAFSEWNGSRWDKTVFLSAGTQDDVDPRIVFDVDGRAFVAWWHQGAGPRVFLARRDTGGTWLPAEEWPGSRPAIATLGHDLHLVFERAVSGGLEITHVVVADGGGGVSLSPLVRVRGAGPTHVGLLVQAGRLWAYWQHTPQQIGWSEYVGSSWVAPASLP